MQSTSTLPVRLSGRIYLILFLVILIASVFFNVKWLQLYRFDQSLDIDEAGYITQAIAYARALEGGGVGAWLGAINQPTAHAPLLPILASVLMAQFGNSENIALFSNVIVNAALCITVFALATGLIDRRAGLVCAVVVASIPIVIDFTRTFQFVVIATLFFTTTIFSYFKSKGFYSAKWSGAIGASLALMIMARTMTIAFLPAFFISFLLHLFLVGGLRDKVVRKNIILSIVVFFLVASTWYVSHYKYVFDYLFSFGYGAHSAEYGANSGVFTIQNFNSRINALFVALRPIHFFLIFPAFCIFLAGGVVAQVRDKICKRDSFLLFVAVLCVLCFFILATSRNRGFGFEVPLFPAMTLVAINWIFKWTGQRLSFFLGSVVLVGVCLPIVYVKADLNNCRGVQTEFDIPFLGRSMVFDCRGLIHEHLDNFGVAVQGGAQVDLPPSILRREAVAWRDLSIKLADFIANNTERRAQMTFALRHALLNVNTVSLEEIKRYGSIWPAVQIDPGQIVQSQDGYMEWVGSAQVRSSCLVFMLNRNDGEFSQKPDSNFLESALKGDGYRIVLSLNTPRSGQQLNAWQRDSANCH